MLVGVGVVASYLFALAVPTLAMLVVALAGAAISIGALRLSGFPEHDPPTAS